MRNVESLMGDDETRRGAADDDDDDDDDEEMEERRPPSTQSFGTSGLAAKFGARKGVGHGKRSLWAVGEEDGSSNEAGPSRPGGHSSEEDDESESGSSMDDETEEDEQEPTKDSERPRTSLWGLAMDTTASQLERAGDANIVSLPCPSSLAPVRCIDFTIGCLTLILAFPSSSSSSSSQIKTFFPRSNPNHHLHLLLVVLLRGFFTSSNSSHSSSLVNDRPTPS